MEQINPPSGLKKLLCYIGNVILFVIYYFGLCFCFGLVIGAIRIVINDSYFAETWLDNVTLVALMVDVVLTIVLRKKMYFHITKNQ